MKNILFFAQRIHAPWIEWVKNNAIEICEWLNKKIKVHIISHRWPENNLDSDTLRWVDVHYLLKLHSNKVLQLFFLIVWWFQSLFFILKTKPEKIFVQYLDTSYLFPLLLIKIFRPKLEVFLTLYSTDEVNIWYKKVFLKYFSFKKIIITSEYLRTSVLELWYEDTDIIFIPLSYDKERFLKYWDFKKRDKKVILFSAGIVKEAGSFFMIDLAKKMPEYKFIFTMRKFDKKSEGEFDTLTKYIKEKNVKNIDLMRNISNMEELLWKISAYVLPLQDIHIKMLIPIALLEAMWRWNTCFVSNLEHLRHLVADWKNAIVFDRDNIEDLKEKIEKNIEKQDLWKQAYEFAKCYPSFENTYEKYYNLIEC